MPALQAGGGLPRVTQILSIPFSRSLRVLFIPASSVYALTRHFAARPYRYVEAALPHNKGIPMTRPLLRTVLAAGVSVCRLAYIRDAGWWGP